MVIEVLNQYGWTTEPNWPWSATKMYDTAVGPKQAIIYYSGGQFAADYNSEGRNVLLTCACPSGPESAPWTAESLESFLADIDRRIDESYARSLWINHGWRAPA